MVDYFAEIPEPNEVTYARGRLPDRFYVSRSFPLRFSRDEGHPGRYVHKVFDEVPECGLPEEQLDLETQVVYQTPKGRKQVELQIARSAGVIRKIRIQRVPTSGAAEKLENLLTLDRDQASRFIELIKALEVIPPEGESTVVVDDQLLRDLFSDPKALSKAYARNPEGLKALIQNDEAADDVIALQRRRTVVATMRSWLNERQPFQAAREEAGGPERAWQRLLEENPWILGVGLGGQLLTSWSADRLEQVTSGANIAAAGKRVDALLRTQGIVQSMVLAEIKHHETELLAKSEYRSSVWGPSPELTGAVVQVQQTVRRAVRDLEGFIPDRAEDGSRLMTGTFITQPRAFLVVGSLQQLQGVSGSPIDDKVHSFELFRRNVGCPEIITFDELLARAEWHVDLVRRQVSESTDE